MHMYIHSTISLSFSLRFCTQRDELLIASISSSITYRNQGRTQEQNEYICMHYKYKGGLPGVPKVFCSEGPLFRRFVVPNSRPIRVLPVLFVVDFTF